MPDLRAETRMRAGCVGHHPPLPTPGISLVPFKDTLYRYIKAIGYEGDVTEIDDVIASVLNSQQKELIIHDEYSNFPILGNPEMLYHDINSNIVYIWNNGYVALNEIQLNADSRIMIDCGTAIED